MANLDNAKIYKKVSTTGTVADQYAVVNLDATNFCVTISGSVYGVSNRFENINTWAVWKRDAEGHVTVATPYDDTDAANKGYVDDNFVDLHGQQEIDGEKTFTSTVSVTSSDEHCRNSSGYDNPHLFIYGTGFAVASQEDLSNRHYYALPNHTGTIALTNDIGLTILDLRGYSK